MRTQQKIMNILKPRRSGSSRKRGSDELSVSREDSRTSTGSTGSSAPKKIGRKTWVKDRDSKRCLRCNKKFGLRSRKHHCRRCGYLCCGGCTKHRVTFESGKRARICKVCFDFIGPSHLRSSSADRHISDGLIDDDDDDDYRDIRGGSGGGDRSRQSADEGDEVSHPLAGAAPIDDFDRNWERRLDDDHSSSSDTDNEVTPSGGTSGGFHKLILHGFGAVSNGSGRATDARPSSTSAKGTGAADSAHSSASLITPPGSDVDTVSIARKKKSGSVFGGLFSGSGGGGNVVTEPLLNESATDARSNNNSSHGSSERSKGDGEAGSTAAKKRDDGTGFVITNREHRGISETEEDFDPNDPYYKSSNSGCCQSCLIM